MQCYQPICLRIEGSHYQSGFSFKNRMPVYSQMKDRFLYVPCGRCLACKAHRVREWTMRIWHEALSWNNGDNGMFLTLTYNKEHVPADYSLHVEHLQKFFKRVRRRLDKYNKKIKHFSCGEYGKRKGRPHYHSIVFGLCWRDEGAKEIVRKSWKFGFVYFGYVSHASSQYVCKYMLKDYSQMDKKTYFKTTGRERPFRVMSKGIGKEYVLKYVHNIVSNLKINFENKMLSIPRSYVRWIERLTDYKDYLRMKIKEETFKGSQKLFDDLSKEYGIEVRKKETYIYEDDYYNIANHLELKEIYEDSLARKEREYIIRHDRFLQKIHNRYVDESVA